jgi:DNA mismatch repair protein MutL
MSAATAAAAASRIALLDPLVADQIAAGEVVERPASVVKELVENALDAGAREVHVTLEDGGRKRVCVRDDGHGMTPDDAQRACLRHATSKLRRIEDLDTLTSLGFRGEALASIAAAAEVTITTRPREASSGVKIEIVQGRARDAVPAGAPVGTTIDVRELFATLPARRKFLKTAATELAHATELLQRLALANPEIGFTCVNGAREVLRYPAVTRHEERVRQVLGAERARVLVPAERGELGLRVHGFVSRAGQSFPQSKGVLTFVDGRLVRDRVLMRAVLDAYRALLPSGRYPSVVLFLAVPPGTVDVNVHPAKVEVRFAQPDVVYGVVLRAVRGALADAAVAPGDATSPGGTSSSLAAMDVDATPSAAAQARPVAGRAPLPGPRSTGGDSAPDGGRTGGDRVQEALVRYAIRRDAHTDPPLFRSVAPSPTRATGATEARHDRASSAAQPRHDHALCAALDEGKTRLHGGEPTGARDDAAERARDGAHVDALASEIARPTFAAMRLVGQAFDGYVVCQAGSSLVLVDQHAAHERVRFERLRAAAPSTPAPSQGLLVPRVVDLDGGAREALLGARDDLGHAGFDLESFGDRSIVLRAIPTALDVATDAERLLADLARDLEQIGSSEQMATARDALLARVACHGAVRFGDPLERAEMTGLLADLDTIPFAATCPHGRPLLIELSRAELQRRVLR